MIWVLGVGSEDKYSCHTYNKVGGFWEGRFLVGQRCFVPTSYMHSKSLSLLLSAPCRQRLLRLTRECTRACPGATSEETL